MLFTLRVQYVSFSLCRPCVTIPLAGWLAGLHGLGANEDANEWRNKKKSFDFFGATFSSSLLSTLLLSPRPPSSPSLRTSRTMKTKTKTTTIDGANITEKKKKTKRQYGNGIMLPLHRSLREHWAHNTNTIEQFAFRVFLPLLLLISVFCFLASHRTPHIVEFCVAVVY